MKLLKYVLFSSLLTFSFPRAFADSIPDGFSRPLQWRIGLDAAPAYVVQTNNFLGGDNSESRIINSYLAGNLNVDFSFAPETRQGMLYPGAYQGIGVGAMSFFADRLFGTPAQFYAYQGYTLFNFTDKLSFGYQWKFGMGIGWKHTDVDPYVNTAVSTRVTALMNVSFRFRYQLDRQWSLSAGIEGNHFSCGNTSLPNRGVNTIGAVIGAAYSFQKPHKAVKPDADLLAEADKDRWEYDLMLYGAWRRRAVIIDDNATLCPGRFGVAGLRFAPMRRFNRWFAAGPSLDMQYDESSGLAPYWVEGTSDDDIRFYRPPFGRQLNIGLSVNAEFIMPVFILSGGVGYDFVCPKGQLPFYQQLTLKTFFTGHLYLNIGYRIGHFKDPQNLMLGLGMRL